MILGKYSQGPAGTVILADCPPGAFTQIRCPALAMFLASRRFRESDFFLRHAKSQLPCWQVIVQIQAGPVLRIQRDIAERPTNARQDKPSGSQLFIQRLFTFHLYPAAEQLRRARTATPLSTTRRDQHTVSF